MILTPKANESYDPKRLAPLLARLRTNDFVKLFFEAKDPLRPNVVGESLWVIVDEWDGSKGVGELNNSPVLLPCSIGHPVEFKAGHVVDVMLA